MSINVANNQVMPEEEDNQIDQIKEKMENNSCTSCLKKIFCFLCI